MVEAGRTEELEKDEEEVGKGRGEWLSYDCEGDEGDWFQGGGDELVGDGKEGECEKDEE